jgi:hypothetical protein
MRQLTQIASNFLQATQRFENEPMRITLAIQLSLSRMQQLEDLAEAWLGPISAALLVEQKSDWEKVVAYYRTSFYSQQYVDIHLVVSSFALVGATSLPVSFLTLG